MDQAVTAPLLHTCSVCHKRAPWGPDWAWYGSILELEMGEHVDKVCSARCRKKLKPARPEASARELMRKARGW